MAKAKITIAEDAVPKHVWDYDIEQFMNFFLVIFKEVKSKQKTSFIIYHDTRDVKYSINQLKGLLLFLKQEVLTLIGYNNHEYDDLMLKHLILNAEMFTKNSTTEEIVNSTKRLSDRIIGQQWLRKSTGKKDKYLSDLKRRREFDSIDLLELSNTVDKVGLKQVAINLKWHNIIDLPFEPDHIVTSNEIDDIVFYCENDVDITAAYRVYKEPDISYRKDLSRLYNINVINSNNTNITKRIIQKFYSEATGKKFEDYKDLITNIPYIKLYNCISPKIRFMSRPYQLILNTMRNHRDIKIIPNKAQGGKKSKQFEYIHKSKFMTHTIGLGGIHSNNWSEEFREDDEFEYIDVDVDSFYPWLIVNEGLYPKQLGPLFTTVYKEKILDMRMTAKRNTKEGIDVDANTVINEALKNTANSTFGLTKSIYTPWLYDPSVTLYITISGQLFLLMLMERIEELTQGIVVYSNTDGLTVRLPKDEEAKADFLRVCRQWEEYTGFSLEYVNYRRMVMKDISNYIMVTSDKKKEIKQKGLFVTEKKISQSYSYPVIADALYEYYINNTPVEQYIKSRSDIFEFMGAERTSTAKYNIYFWPRSDDPKPVKLQKSNRWLVTKGNSEEGQIIKYSKTRITKKGQIAQINMQKGRLLTIVNNVASHLDIAAQHIDYDFYIIECMKIIKSIRKYGGPGAKRYSQASMFNM